MLKNGKIIVVDSAIGSSSLIRQWGVAIALIALAALALPARGVMLVNVDLNGGTDFQGDGTGPTYSGPGIVSLSPTDQWNGIAAPPNQTDIALTNSTGAPTGVTLTTSGFEYATTYSGQPTSVGQSAFVATPYNDLMEDFFGIYSLPGPVTLTFHNLPANSSAEFVLYGQAQAGVASGGQATIGASSLSWSGDGNASTFIPGVNYVDFSSIVTDGSGNLVVTIDQFGNPETDINGFQLLVPEPASLSLIGLGAALLIRRRAA